MFLINRILTILVILVVVATIGGTVYFERWQQNVEPTLVKVPINVSDRLTP